MLHFIKIVGAMAQAMTPATWEMEVEGSQSESIPGKSTRTYLKNKVKTKRPRGMAQVVELYSVPLYGKKKKNVEVILAVHL
jgi:hypothetical protein